MKRLFGAGRDGRWGPARPSRSGLLGSGILPARRTALGLIVTGIATFAVPSPAAAQTTARCDIGNSDGESYHGPCIFTLGPKGSFSVVRYGNAPIVEDLVEVRVIVISPGVAEVHGVTASNTELRWGRATRATSNKACWRSTSFWICVYG